MRVRRDGSTTTDIMILQDSRSGYDNTPNSFISEKITSALLHHEDTSQKKFRVDLHHMLPRMCA